MVWVTQASNVTTPCILKRQEPNQLHQTTSSVLCHSIKFFIDKNTCRKKATIKNANYFYWHLEKKLNRDAQKGEEKSYNKQSKLFLLVFGKKT